MKVRNRKKEVLDKVADKVLRSEKEDAQDAAARRLSRGEEKVHQPSTDPNVIRLVEGI